MIVDYSIHEWDNRATPMNDGEWITLTDMSFRTSVNPNLPLLPSGLLPRRPLMWRVIMQEWKYR